MFYGTQEQISFILGGLLSSEVKGPDAHDEGYVQAEIRYVCPKLECRDVNGLSACFFHSFDGISTLLSATKNELPNGSDSYYFGAKGASQVSIL